VFGADTGFAGSEGAGASYTFEMHSAPCPEGHDPCGVSHTLDLHSAQYPACAMTAPLVPRGRSPATFLVHRRLMCAWIQASRPPERLLALSADHGRPSRGLLQRNPPKRVNSNSSHRCSPCEAVLRTYVIRSLALAPYEHGIGPGDACWQSNSNRRVHGCAARLQSSGGIVSAVRRTRSP
jgi:hypothetical protein